MNELKTKFEQAQQDVVSLSERPNNTSLLKLYSFYKQATVGDVQGSAPGIFDLVAKKKYEAWKKLVGTSKEVAMQEYINEVERLLQE